MKMPNRNCLIQLSAKILLLCLMPTLVTAEDLVYVSAKNDRAILVYRFDDSALFLKQTLQLPAEPGALTFLKDRHLLLVALRSSGELASCKVDPKTGRLKLLNIVSAGADPAHLSADASGQFLLTAYYVASKVSVHQIQSDGQLSVNSIQEFPTAEKAHAINLSPDQKFALVPHTGPDAIFQFRWEPARGRLVACKPDRFQCPKSTGPRHLAWHPKIPNKIMVGNERGNSVTAYHLDPDSGQLSHLASASTLPNDYGEPNSTAEIKIHPSGQWLYVSNRGHHSLARIKINPNSLNLEWQDTTPTESVPRSFDLTDDGKYLLAAGESSGGIQIYGIDQNSGKLTSIRRYNIADGLWWILCTSIPD